MLAAPEKVRGIHNQNHHDKQYSRSLNFSEYRLPESSSQQHQNSASSSLRRHGIVFNNSEESEGMEDDG